ncbi:FAD/NAD(P)-dependent oxidoreductase [Shewanella surugensis]|uniref:NAD(P)/FAD-dependent oxidoreductase n=1 Tax=Shewanella surugensis TaxID=212020 RepID=A0ABT0L8T3_9GAMM|nr:NAD(P)/FAD-dependent oxidoreductase [Shewanella surugensis]MCL1124113.1 NAD(P)/FAD-dependent oxidoreductase [Shewanella surugensis]
MPQSTLPVVIVGAGTAGISAAAELAETGIHSIVIDEAPRIGGAVFRGPFREAIELPHLDNKLRKKISNIRQLYQDNQPHIQLMLETRVLGPSGDNALLVRHKDDVFEVPYEQLIIATGCHERSIPFDGWQLPGIMLLGGVQLQLKSGLVKPGQKIAIVGTGPLLPLVACQLHKAGVHVVGVYEAGKFSGFAKESRAFLNRPLLTLEGMGLLSYLKAHAIPIHYGWGIVSAKGQDSLNNITVAQYNEDWYPIQDTETDIEVDSLAVGYGFVSRNQLAQLMDIEHDICSFSGLKPQVNEWQMSNQANIYIAGDSVGILGGEGAMMEGRIAALAIAQEIKILSSTAVKKKASKYFNLLNKVKLFRAGFDRVGRRREGLLSLLKPDTLVCRCENVTRADIDKVINQGVKDITSLKMRTRVGMGDCQGKTCNSYCQDRLRQELDTLDVGYVKPRFPLDPIPFSALSEGV